MSNTKYFGSDFVWKVETQPPASISQKILSSIDDFSVYDISILVLNRDQRKTIQLDLKKCCNLLNSEKFKIIMNHR